MDVSPTVPFALPMSHVFGTMLMPTAEDGRTPLVPNPLAPGTMIANPAPYGLVQNPTNPYQLVPAGPDHVTPMLPDPTQPNMLAPFGTLHKAAIVHPDAQGRGAYGGLYPRSVEAGLAAMYQYQTGGAGDGGARAGGAGRAGALCPRAPGQRCGHGPPQQHPRPVRGHGRLAARRARHGARGRRG